MEEQLLLFPDDEGELTRQLTQAENRYIYGMKTTEQNKALMRDMLRYGVFTRIEKLFNDIGSYADAYDIPTKKAAFKEYFSDRGIELQKIIKMRQGGKTWKEIQEETGFRVT